MSSSNGVFAHQRNSHRNAGKMLKRPFDNPGGYVGRIGGFQEEDRSRYAPPQKLPRYQTKPQFQSAKPNGGGIPMYRHHHHHDSNLSRVSNYGDVINSNSSNVFLFALRNNGHSQSNAEYHKPYGYGNPNPQSVPLPLPYRKLDGFDSLPEWVPNFVPNTNREITGVRFNGNQLSQAPPVFTNLPNSMPLNHSNMVSVVSQSLPQQPIVSKELADLLSVLNNEKEKEKECDLGLEFDKINLSVRHESVIKSLYSDMPRQCSSCGVRFKGQEEHSKHMDWHVRKNRMAKDATKAATTTRVSQKPKKSRDWFANSSLWLSAATGAAIEGAKPVFGETQKTKEEEKQQQHIVPADENQKMCALCLESLEEFFSHEEDDWMYRDAAYLNMNGSGPIVHVNCMPEPRKGPAKESAKLVTVASAVVC